MSSTYNPKFIEKEIQKRIDELYGYMDDFDY